MVRIARIEHCAETLFELGPEIRIHNCCSRSNRSIAKYQMVLLPLAVRWSQIPLDVCVRRWYLRVNAARSFVPAKFLKFVVGHEQHFQRASATRLLSRLQSAKRSL